MRDAKRESFMTQWKAETVSNKSNALEEELQRNITRGHGRNCMYVSGKVK
jgi:hypothetical protein